ncbi:hypothetical protein ASZ90_010045 [hydrocarbon metagenome]|uniref:PrsW family intramembrane metalloprotease n=1 Tax=hydrocarbon metagenome TaxID=938273 RepID=A0A0W8FHJ6_9ZZZZ
MVWGGLVYVLAGRAPRCLWLILPGLPLSAIVNIAVKAPLAAAVADAGGVDPLVAAAAPLWYLAFLLMLAPVTEEAIKAAPLVAPQLRRFAESRRGALSAGMALGVGFGIGEAAYLAYAVSLSPVYADLPWYLFIGFLQERFVVTFIHGALTAIVVTGMLRGAAGLLAGYLAAVLLHALLNSGALLYQIGRAPLWGAQVTIFAALILLVAIILRLHRRAGEEEASAAPDVGE